ncbi:MAG TPA: ABC transporter substrate-binding protein [Nostocaceae cyanobacterium]|nr:ABC transporter substrate-binding protein [Nostocaceae cyanobacterium]
MSQKNEIKIYILSFLLTVGLVGGVSLLFLRSPEPKLEQKDTTNLVENNLTTATERISFGEKSLISGNVSASKQEGIKALANQDYQQAVEKFTLTLAANKNDPEALIFLNNARIGTNKSYTLVASVPLGNDPNAALEILRGVAQAQNQINLAGGIKGVPLKIGIANDEDKPEISQQIATDLVKNSEVLGVIGHNSSDATLAAGKVYDSGKLVAISPISTSVKLSQFSPYVLRTVPSDFVASRTLANYMFKNLGKKNVAVFFNSQSNYSQSLKAEFVSSVSLEGGQVVGEFDLSQADFSPARSVDQAIKNGAEVLMLAANGSTLDKALQVVQINQQRLKILAGDDVYTVKTLEVGREQALDMVVAVPWHIDGDPTSQFPAQSRQLWGGDVSWRTALAYDATRALIAALEVNPTRPGIQQALLGSSFSTPGASGTIRFLPSGDRNAPVRLVKVVRGDRSRTGFDFEPIKLEEGRRQEAGGRR